MQLHIALSDISGVSRQALIRALLAGERDTKVLAKLRDPRCSDQRRGDRSEFAGQLKRVFCSNCSKRWTPTIFTNGNGEMRPGTAALHGRTAYPGRRGCEQACRV